MNKNYDDGNWNWKYECIYVNETNDPKDYYYVTVFDATNDYQFIKVDITCFYKPLENILEIHKEHTSIKFFVENFSDIKNILKPMIKSYNAITYPIYVSKKSIRRDKLNNLS